ncbi:MAG: hypothetical protein EBU90_03855 [Proteobacteria bacterium]|nr:hypothetical protein [Pseudomonadota bacterium]NBP14204.1 hypothetical protein [bacterium]
MLDFLKIDPDFLTLIISIIGGLGTFFSLIWLNVVKPLVKLLNNQDSFKESFETIRKELTTNGGNSLKDVVIDLKSTCGRIETRQKIIEQRTKAALHYSQAALFETDHDGRLVWSNVNFCEFMKSMSANIEGYDWLNCIDEDDRQSVLQEFQSCLELNKKFFIATKLQNGINIKMTGYPYRINDEKHGGFLISITEQKEV